MRAFLFALLAWLLAVSAPVPAWAAESAPVDTGKVVARLVASHDGLAPGQTFDLALLTELDEGWHTYWRNPGDSGEPVYMELRLPDGATHSDIFWPVPMPVPTGPIINYGFEGAPLFPVEVTVPADATSPFEMEADVYYLVCKDICIPESTTLSLSIPVFDAVPDPKWESALRDSKARSPKSGTMTGGAQVTDGSLVVKIKSAAGLEAPYLFPYPNTIIDHSAPQTPMSAADGVRFDLTPGFGWSDGGTPEPFDAVLAYDAPDGTRAGQVVRVVPGQDVDIGALAAAAPAADSGTSGTSLTLLAALGGALLGGLILNLMPCVFPVISIKALSLTRAAHAERRVARVEGWMYAAGVMATFLALALALVALKAGGASLGWGFQLQDPRVVGFLALLTFLIGLNLLGVFEIGGRLQGAGQGLVEQPGRAGAFWTGVLAVVVATPCTAPFMAGAVGWALAQPALATLSVFAALGFGFAAPFLLLAYSPGLLARLPKPGPWMETFRQVLAFPMFATAVWLAWVVGNQAGSDGTAMLLGSALLLAFAVWWFRRTGLASRVVGVAASLLALLVPLGLTAQASAPGDLDELAWSADAIAAERAAGRAVFVDFTADWCVTCKVNDRLVLSRPSVRELFAKTDTAFMVADWTNKNDSIADELARWERSGIPLYLVYPPGTDAVDPVILPQVLTEGIVESALRDAQE